MTANNDNAIDERRKKINQIIQSLDISESESTFLYEDIKRYGREEQQAAVTKALQKVRAKIEAKRIPYNRFNIATQMREFNHAQERNILLQEILKELDAILQEGKVR